MKWNVYLSMANENLTRIKDYQVLNEAPSTMRVLFLLKVA